MFSLELECVPSTSPCFLFLGSCLTCRLDLISSLGVFWLGIVVGTVVYLPGLASHTSLALWIAFCFKISLSSQQLTSTIRLSDLL